MVCLPLDLVILTLICVVIGAAFLLGMLVRR